MTETQFTSPHDPSSINRNNIRQVMRPLNLVAPSPMPEEVLHYVRYYGLDMAAEFPDINHYQGWFEAAGYRISAQVFVPPKAQGTVFILHGFLEHSALYGHMIRDCLKHRHAVFIYDQIGHGLSSGAAASVASFNEYQQVLQAALQQFASQLPQPFYLLGLSMGGGIAMDHVLSACASGQQPAFKQVLLLAPLLRPAEWWKIRFGYHLLRFFIPSVTRLFRRNSSDLQYLAFVRDKDPLQARATPMAWIGALRQWVKRMEALPPCQWPVLLVQGGKDETVDWEANSRFVRSHFQVVHDTFVPGASHQLPNERDDLRAPVHAALALMLSGRARAV